MARLLRVCLAGIPQHIIQRGNNRQACFASDEDLAAYAHWLEACARKFRVAIHAGVFMTNHVQRNISILGSKGDGGIKL
jgi:putative transposase